MSSNNCIIPECYIDSCLIEVLLQANRDHVNHKKGNGTVANEMKNKFANDFCVGIIDEDRKDLDYLNEFDLVSETNYLKLRKHKRANHYIIQVRPVIEKWMMSICSEFGIPMNKFDLPDNWIDLVRISKSVTSKHDQRFIRLFKKMKSEEVEPVMQLQKWLEYLKANKYNADINQLKNG
jgi:hypothetical protein